MSYAARRPRFVAFRPSPPCCSQSTAAAILNMAVGASLQEMAVMLKGAFGKPADFQHLTMHSIRRHRRASSAAIGIM
jgi:hypothetical protein